MDRVLDYPRRSPRILDQAPVNPDSLWPLHHAISETFSWGNYSQMLLDPTFHSQFNTTWVLRMEIDGAICSNSNATVEDFLALDYDCYGAPWVFLQGPQCGNGGVSLRKSKVFSDNAFPAMVGPEDGEWTRRLRRVHARMPPIAVGQRFSVETICFSSPWAFHKPHLGRCSVQQLRELSISCPELNQSSGLPRMRQPLNAC